MREVGAQRAKNLPDVRVGLEFEARWSGSAYSTRTARVLRQGCPSVELRPGWLMTGKN